MKFNRKPPPGNVRRVVSTGTNIRGVITNKAGRLVQFESWAERALLLRIDRDPNVMDYGSQPEQFKFTDSQGKCHRYTPDFIVWRNDGQVEIHEVTLSKRRTNPTIQQREVAAAKICQARGWDYIVHTEQTLPQGCELANLLALFRYRPAAYADKTSAKIAVDMLGQEKSITTGFLIEHISCKLSLPQSSVVAALGHMLWHGQICTDLHQPIFVNGGVVPKALVQLPLFSEEGNNGTHP